MKSFQFALVALVCLAQLALGMPHDHEKMADGTAPAPVSPAQDAASPSPSPSP